MSIVEQVADIFAKAGGFGIAAVFAWMYFRKDKELSDLQAELRGELKSTTSELVRVLTENNLLSQQQVATLQRFLDRAGDV